MKICGLVKTTLLDYPGHVACTLFTGGCNFRCPFCHNSEILDFSAASEYTEEEILDFLEKRKGILDGVCISGGEPTVHAELPEFISKIRERYGLKVKLDTNGTNYELLKMLIKDELIDYVAMDIKSGWSGYAKTAGIKEESVLIDSVMKSKELLLEGHIPYEFRTTYVIGLHTGEDFKEIAEMIKGADRYFIQAYRDNENVLNRAAGYRSPEKEELLSAAELVRPYVKYLDIRGIDI